jgi:hypothetical protein
MIGRSNTRSNSFGTALVAGSILLPKPATGITAFLTFGSKKFPSLLYYKLNFFKQLSIQIQGELAFDISLYH